MKFTPLFYVVAALFFAPQARAEDSETVMGTCKIIITDAVDISKVLRVFPAPLSTYQSMHRCVLQQPPRCAGEWWNFYEGLEGGMVALLHGHLAAAWYQWDCLPWGADERVPSPERRFEPLPVPEPVGEPRPSLNFRDLPSLQRLLDVLRGVWEFSYEHCDELPWDVILGITVILIGLGLLKGGQLTLTGPGAAEPVSLAVALCAIVVLLWPHMPAAERAKYRDFNRAGIIEKEDGAWVITNPLDGKKTRIEIGADGAWSYRSPTRCRRGASDENQRTATADGEC